MSKIAAIDIGSNALRLVIADSEAPSDRAHSSRFRKALRLGSEAFQQGYLKVDTVALLVRALREFMAEVKKQNAKLVAAVGTSAMREASNTAAVIDIIEREVGIRVDVISGQEEVQYAHTALKYALPEYSSQNILFIDIGGGSLELGLTEKGQLKASQSFPLGTVRTLGLMKEQKVPANKTHGFLFSAMRPVWDFLETQQGNAPPDLAVGIGGNLECMGRLRVKILNKRSFFKMQYSEVEKLLLLLEKLSVQERGSLLNLRKDRADVILPATSMVLHLLTEWNIKKLRIPHVGLREGVLWTHYPPQSELLGKN